MESWFSTVKSEEGERFESYAHAKEALFGYIEVFYNQRRRHSTLDRSAQWSSNSDRLTPHGQNRPPNRIKPSCRERVPVLVTSDVRAN
jgi:transposase InsO family protein